MEASIEQFFLLLLFQEIRQNPNKKYYISFLLVPYITREEEIHQLRISYVSDFKNMFRGIK